jgi:hypothetical protein
MNCIGIQINPFLLTIYKIKLKKEIELKTFSMKKEKKN